MNAARDSFSTRIGLSDRLMHVGTCQGDSKVCDASRMFSVETDISDAARLSFSTRTGLSDF